MSDQFVSAITDEAMSRVCYDGGWNLTPFMFYISQTDVLEGWSDSRIFNADGSITDEVYEYLKQYTTEQMEHDYTSGNVWYSAQFSSISQANSTTLTHHINIPGDLNIDTSSKDICTIYFIYKDSYGQLFLYALARSNARLIFEHGVTQSFFFNFTVTNSATQEMTEFILNYSCAHEIEDHNTTFGPDTHSNLVARDGSRLIENVLRYNNLSTSKFNNPDDLISLKYIQEKLIPLINDTICPPGKLDWWPGAPNTIPDGWAVRNGQLLRRDQNPKLYQMFGQKYRKECRTGTSYNANTYFPLMNDCGVFIRGSELSSNGQTVQNTNLLNGVAFGNRQNSAAPNIIGQSSILVIEGAGGTGAMRVVRTSGAGIRATRSAYSKGYVNIDASRSSSVYNNSTEIRPYNRNYLPIIKLG